MWDRMTERAQKVIRLAQEEALALNHQAVGTEHLLLGLIKEGQGVAARSLQNLQINIEQVREQVIQVIGKGETKPEGQPGLTPRAKKVLELALDESRRQGVNYIGTEHILLGLIREGEGIAARVLANMGVTAADIRKQVVELLGGVLRHRSSPPFSLGDLFGFMGMVRAGSFLVHASSLPGQKRKRGREHPYPGQLRQGFDQHRQGRQSGSGGGKAEGN
jgi:ATP-dependent Clp protease ATP-binding subunit ClpC